MKQWIAAASAAVLAYGVLGANTALAQGWEAAVAQLIASKQAYPRSAQIRGDEGTARLRVRIAADGKIEKVELLKESGSDILDREALRIPAKVGQVPPPPGARPTDIVVPITWKLT